MVCLNVCVIFFFINDNIIVVYCFGINGGSGKKIIWIDRFFIFDVISKYLFLSYVVIFLFNIIDYLVIVIDCVCVIL